MKAKPRPFTTSEVKEVIRLHGEGKTQAETGEILGRHAGVYPMYGKTMD